MPTIRPKNFRLGQTTLDHIKECMDDLGLTTEVMAIRVAVEHLYASRRDLNITKYLVDLRKYDTSTTPSNEA